MRATVSRFAGSRVRRRGLPCSPASLSHPSVYARSVCQGIINTHSKSTPRLSTTSPTSTRSTSPTGHSSQALSVNTMLRGLLERGHTTSRLGAKPRKGLREERRVKSDMTSSGLAILERWRPPSRKAIRAYTARHGPQVRNGKDGTSPPPQTERPSEKRPWSYPTTIGPGPPRRATVEPPAYGKVIRPRKANRTPPCDAPLNRGANRDAAVRRLCIAFVGLSYGVRLPASRKRDRNTHVAGL